MVRKGKRDRSLLGKDGGVLRLQRSYQSCAACGVQFFPLDEELGLAPGSLTPRLAEAVIYTGSVTAFDRATEVLKRLLGGDLSESLVRQLTERAGSVMDGCERGRAAELQRKPVCRCPAMGLLSR